MEEIQAWLDGDRDFHEGLALLQQHNKNRVLFNNISRKESQWAKDKLAYELGKLVESVPTVVTTEANPTAENTLDETLENQSTKEEKTADDSSKVETEETGKVVSLPINPNELADITQMIADVFTERAKLSNQLSEIPEGAEHDADRKAISEQIDVLEATRESLHIRKEILEGKRQPEAPKVEKVRPQPTSLAEWKLERKARCEKVSKVKKNLKAKPSDVELQTELAKAELDLTEADDRIKLMKANGQK